MERIDFKNYPDESTPLSAENLNQLQANTEEALTEELSSLQYHPGDETTINFTGRWFHY